MPDALGEFGLNPLAAIKQQILESIRDSVVSTLEQVQAQFHRDAKAQEIIDCVHELQRANQVHLSTNKEGRITVHAMRRAGETEDQILNLLLEQ